MSNNNYKILFDKAVQLLNGRINLDGKALPSPGFFERIKLKRAAAAFEEAAAAEPQNAAPLLLIAKIEERLGRNEKCIAWLKKANAIEPNVLMIVLELGAALGRQGLYAESASILVTAAKACPDDPRVHCNLGLSMLMAGEANNAIQAFEYVLTLEPERLTNKKLLDYAIAVLRKEKPVPKTESEIAKNI